MLTDPSSPGQINFGDKSPTSLTISWVAAPLESYSFYRVSITDPMGNEKFADPIYPSEPTQYTFTDLDPETDYTVTVVTVLEADTSMNLVEQLGDTSQRETFSTGEHVKQRPREVRVQPSL